MAEMIVLIVNTEGSGVYEIWTMGSVWVVIGFTTVTLPSRCSSAFITLEGQCLTKNFHQSLFGVVLTGNSYWQYIPSTFKEMVREVVSWVGVLTIGSVLTTSASNPASSTVSTTTGVNSCESATIRAEWPMRSTTTSETPSTSDKRRVRVFEQAAQVIPPIERDRTTGPCSSAGDPETSGTFSEIGS